MNDKQQPLIVNDTESIANISTALSGSSQKPSIDRSKEMSNTASEVSNVTPAAATDDCARAIGARLAQLREHKQCLLDDVSAQLKVPVEKLRALEAGDFSHLPDAAFTVGVVRRYAKMFGVDPTPLVNEMRSAYGPLEPELVLPGLRSGGSLRKHLPTMTQSRRSKKRRLWLWGIGVLALVICIALYWQGNKTVSTHRAPPVANNSSASVNPLVSNETNTQSKLFKIAQHKAQTAHLPTQLNPVAPSPSASASDQVTSLSSASANKSTNAAAAAASGSKESGAAANPLGARDQSLIHFKVSQNNWVSVRQHDGKEVYASLLYAGDECDVQGVPPFKITVGNHTGLKSVTLNGKQVDPSKYMQAKQKVVHFDLP